MPMSATHGSSGSAERSNVERTASPTSGWRSCSFSAHVTFKQAKGELIRTEHLLGCPVYCVR
eukprot:scaffold3210_cov402-Prasinococcus_capsulatus_cf.AAC.16